MNTCNICKKEIRLELKGETTQGESYHQIHDESCILNGVEDNLESIARRIKYAIKPFVMPRESEETRLRNEAYDRENFRPAEFWNE